MTDLGAVTQVYDLQFKREQMKMESMSGGKPLTPFELLLKKKLDNIIELLEISEKHLRSIAFFERPEDYFRQISRLTTTTATDEVLWQSSGTGDCSITSGVTLRVPPDAVDCSFIVTHDDSQTSVITLLKGESLAVSGRIREIKLTTTDTAAGKTVYVYPHGWYDNQNLNTFNYKSYSGG